MAQPSDTEVSSVRREPVSDLLAPTGHRVICYSYKPVGAAPRGWPGQTVKRCFFVYLVMVMVIIAVTTSKSL